MLGTTLAAVKYDCQPPSTWNIDERPCHFCLVLSECNIKPCAAFYFFHSGLFFVFHLSEVTSSQEKLVLQSTLCSFRDHWNAWCIKSLRSNIRMKVLAPIRLIEQQYSAKIINLWYITCHQNEWKINCNTVELFYKRHWCKRRLIMRDTDVPKIEIGFDQKTKMWYPAS